MFLNNKYTTLYYKIINNRKQNPATGYNENHHIIPHSLGGNGCKDNMVRLSAKEHYICHRLLTKMTEGVAKQKMWYALNCFIRPLQKTRPEMKITSRIVEQARKESSEYLSSIRKGNATRPAGTYNHSAETKRKMSKSRKGQINRPAGYTHSAETIELMRKNRKGKNAGKPSWNKGIVQECPHCHKQIRGTLNRWHGDNCKLAPHNSH